MMAKLHKKPFGWKPILNCINHQTSKFSMLFDFLIRPLILESITDIKDTKLNSIYLKPFI